MYLIVLPRRSVPPLGKPCLLEELSGKDQPSLRCESPRGWESALPSSGSAGVSSPLAEARPAVQMWLDDQLRGNHLPFCSTLLEVLGAEVTAWGFQVDVGEPRPQRLPISWPVKASGHLRESLLMGACSFQEEVVEEAAGTVPGNSTQRLDALGTLLSLLCGGKLPVGTRI